MYAVIAGWDADNRVTSANWVATEAEAMACVNRLHGKAPTSEELVLVKANLDAQGMIQSVWDNQYAKAQQPLAVDKQVAGAYYAIPTVPDGCHCISHRPRFWVVDVVAKTVTVDLDLAKAQAEKEQGRVIDAECSHRMQTIYTPQDTQMDVVSRRQNLQEKGRAAWSSEELSDWNATQAKVNRAEALKTSAQTIKDAFAGKTPEEIDSFTAHDADAWSE